jgi:hypothetical protein
LFCHFHRAIFVILSSRYLKISAYFSDFVTGLRFVLGTIRVSRQRFMKNSELAHSQYLFAYGFVKFMSHPYSAQDLLPCAEVEKESFSNLYSFIFFGLSGFRWYRFSHEFMRIWLWIVSQVSRLQHEI